ncbi:FixH family protein [Sphingomonas sp. G-3-2-10]|uniref:FixH family protein n=1 Tax=Sphingomonas sp. G-3-2-10 TaxID=2728838 RepID=UPI00146A2582|nr:FixH family protein [Sphingomonas sp. G-3-2-10]NML07840.1 FixH family protein [Sphingomonas sp. G-3-2-10]
MTRRFTGWHMAGIMVSFFAVVIAVNFYMATQASRTFGGVVVENSYVASQRFNGWLADARAQDALGWRATPAVDDAGRVTVVLADNEGAIRGATVMATATHPVGRLSARSFALRDMGDGRYGSAEALAAGRWQLRIDVRAQGREARFEQDVRR